MREEGSGESMSLACDVICRRMLVAVLMAGLVACSSAHVATPAHDSEAPVVYDTSDEGAASGLPASRLAGAFAAGEVTSVRLIGDSITDGDGCDGFGERTQTIVYRGANGTYYESSPAVACWANDFRAYAASVGVPEEGFVNAGISGARMAWLADEPDAWLGDGADVILVMLGTNDAVWSTPEEYALDAEVALSAAAAASNHLVVVSPPNNLRTDGRARFGMAEVDAILTRICEAHGYEHLSLLDVTGPDDGSLNADLIHPTSLGSHMLWERLRLELGLRP